MTRTVFLSGATSGIGKATAQLLARSGNYRLVLCGRRDRLLKQLGEELSPHAHVHTLCFDVRDRDEVERQISSLPDEFRDIDVLINNAGNAHGLDPIHEGNIDDWEAMIDINLKGLLYVTRFLLPGMVGRGAGQIINIGSIAGKEAYPKGNVYCATKSAVDALSKAMRIDLCAHGIRVAEVNPGAVETEFSLVRFKGDAARADQVYQGFEPLRAEDVAELILFVITRPPHVNIAESLILPAAQANAGMVVRKP
jgi:3-hydroxy acid dehydrogenase / malonic semialdehyde reductase